MFKISVMDSSFSIYFENKLIVSNLGLYLFGYDSDRMILPISDYQNSGDKMEIAYEYPAKNVFVKLVLRMRNNTLIGSVAVLHTVGTFEKNFFLNVAKSLCLVAEKIHSGNQFIGISMVSDFWTKPYFIDDASKVKEKTNLLLFKNYDKYCCLTPLVGNKFYAQIGLEDSKPCISLQSNYIASQIDDQPFFAIGVMDNPYGLTDWTIRDVVDTCNLKTKLRIEKSLPEIFEYFGWCTWDAFYKNISEEKIFQKMEEFKSKGIPVKWVILDDGWQQFSDDLKLRDIQEDRKKFPNGLKHCITRLKEQYGVQKVGVWHSLACYWNGIQKESPASRKFRDALVEHNSLLLPPFEAKASEIFWNMYHSFLKSEGVDFVKVDNQSEIFYQYLGLDYSSAVSNQIHEGLERSVKTHFAGTMINCMGMNLIDVWNRNHSSVNRNSDDFYPLRENGFAYHAIENAYNSFYHSPFAFQDWDMWWTGSQDVERSKVLRVMGSSLVYISDRLNETDPVILAPLMNNEGLIFKCTGVPFPAKYSMFNNPYEKGKLGIVNTEKDSVYFALFNLGKDNINEQVRLIDFLTDYDGNGKYLVRSCIDNKYSVLSEVHDLLRITVQKHAVCLFQIIKIRNGFAVVGVEEKLIASAVMKYGNGTDENTCFRCLDRGTLVVYCEKQVLVVKKNLNEISSLESGINKIRVQKNDRIVVGEQQ